MIKIDLITGFLGSGKTTFIKYYAQYLMSQKIKTGIIVNDFGAVNIDMMLLQELPDEQCQIEMITGGGDRATYLRRLKTKLIALKMQGIERVLFEPSGIFDVDDFLDILHDEPINQWYEAGSIIAIADKELDTFLPSPLADMLAWQLLSAGKIVISKVDQSEQGNINIILEQLSRFLKQYEQNFQLTDVLCQDWSSLTQEDYEQLVHCGYKTVTLKKKSVFHEDMYQSVYIMNKSLTRQQVVKKITAILSDHTCGNIFRVKGFVLEGLQWYEINIVGHCVHIKEIENGQDIIIIIGERLSKEKIKSYFQ